MTLRHLKVFVTVCECGGITAAAEKLYIAQPSVSLAVSELEAYYGIRLFDRISRKLYLTDIGKHFLRYAIHIISLFDEMEQGIRDWDKLGSLRLGASITIGNYFIPAMAKEFKQHYPDMELHVHIQNSEAIEEKVLDNSLDFGLIEGVVHSPHLIVEKFMDDELVLICGPGHLFSNVGKISLENLKNQIFIMREKGSAGREFFDSLLTLHNMEIKPAWESVSTQAIVRAVSAGLGLSVLPFLLVKGDLERGSIIRVPMAEGPLKRQFSIIYHKNKYLTNSMKYFFKICKTGQWDIDGSPCKN